MRGALRPATLAAIAFGAAAIAGCGAAKTISSVVDPVAQAADVTTKVPGYRMAGTITMTVNGRSLGRGTLSGVFASKRKIGSLSTQLSVQGHEVSVLERFAGSTIYLHPSTGGSGSLPPGKTWIKIDEIHAAGSPAGAVPGTGSDPSHFVDYLRAAGRRAQKLGTASVRGVLTIHYRVSVDLDRYTRLVAPSWRANAQRAVAALEAGTGSHTLTSDVWVDGHELVRRMSLGFGECISGHRLGMAMTMDFYDFGPQATPRLPAANQTADLTTQAGQALKHATPSCSSA